MALKMETENHCHVPEEKGYLFHSEDTQSTEDEYLHLLHALVYSIKPQSVLETGAFKGMGTAFIAKALRRNGFGTIVSVEKEIKAAEWAQELLRVNQLEDWALIVVNDSLEAIANSERKFDFAFFDSQLYLRCKELQLCLDKGLLLPGAFFAMHDTSRLRTISPGEPDPYTPTLWRELEAIKGIKFLEFPLSRGLVIGQVV